MSLPIFRRLLFFLPLLFAFSVPASSGWRDLHLQNGCTISRVDLSGPRQFPGSFCLFLRDGSLISGGQNFLRKIGADGNVIWERKEIIHHQLNLSGDGKRILALSSGISVIGNEAVRFDEFVIYDLDGSLIARKSARDLLSETRTPFRMRDLLAPSRAYYGADKEGSHFNSISEVPRIGSRTIPSLKEGNIVVNGLGSGVFVLSPDLKTTIFHVAFSHSLDHLVHDVQVTPEGEFLYFNNRVKDARTVVPYSRVQIWNPRTKKMRASIGPTPGGYFYSPASGSVQLLPGKILLFTHMFTGGFFTDETGKLLGSFFGGTGDPPFLIPFQHVRAVDASEFLRNHRPPSSR